MTVRPLPDSDHIARHVRKRLVQRKGDEVIGCFPQAFELRQATETVEAETYLSASWFEFFDGTRDDRLKGSLREMGGYLTIKPKDALAIVNVGKIRSVGLTRGTKLRVLHEPDPPTAPAYATVRGMRRDDNEILSLLAAEAVAEAVEVASIK